MNPIEKAIELRESRRLLSKQSKVLFSNRIQEPLVILRLIEESSSQPSMLQEARRSFCVSLCAAFEVYWREFFRVNLASYKPTPHSLSHFPNLKFSLSDLTVIRGNRITIHELITSALSFKGLDALNSASSIILQRDAFSDFRKHKYVLKEVAHKKRSKKDKPLFHQSLTGAQVLDSHASYINRCFQIRHETVHDTGLRYTLSKEEPFDFWHSMNSFNILYGLFLQTRIKEEYGITKAK